MVVFVIAAAAAVAYGESFRLVSCDRHLGQAFAQHNRLAQLNRHRYAVCHPNVSNSTVAVSVVDSHVQMPTFNTNKRNKNKMIESTKQFEQFEQCPRLS